MMSWCAVAPLYRGLFIAISLLLGTAVAGEQQSFTLKNGDEIPFTRYPASGDRLLLWLPSEFGLSPRQQPIATQLAQHGVEVWIPDLHTAWFLPTGRYSLNGVDPGAIRQILESATASGRQVYLLAAGRTSTLALRALRDYQQVHGGNPAIKGVISMGPRLFLHTPQGGKPATFLPIATASNVPVFILQPRNTGGFWRIGSIARTLEKGGAPVFVQILDGVRDGFYLREDFTPQEEATTARLPAILLGAMHQLDTYAGLPATPAPMATPDRAPEADHPSALLRPYPGRNRAPGLSLSDLKGRPVSLAQLHGKVVLVNFWATWCPPCVKEIPSLERLYQARRRNGLEILAVNVGESRSQVQRFLADKPVSFTVLLDSRGRAFKHWGVHAFPTTLVVDRSQHIRYAGFGAFAWDSPEVTQTLDCLLAEPSSGGRHDQAVRHQKKSGGRFSRYQCLP